MIPSAIRLLRGPRQRMGLPALVLLLATCAPAVEAPREDAAQMEAWREELMSADRAFAEATALRGAEGWVSFFAPDGAMVSEGVGEARGTETIRERVTATFADPSVRLTWEPSRAEVSRSGDLGYTVGRWESTRSDPRGQTSRLGGIYVTIWRRLEDGSWKVVMDLGNPAEGEE